MNRNSLRKLTLAALCVALGVIFPQLFHMIPRSGMILLPMHLPLLLCGLLTGPFWGLVAGVVTPILSNLITGMPPMGPILYSMIFELAVYGFLAGVLFQFIRTKYVVLDLYLSLILAMLGGRIIYGLANGLIFSAGTGYGIEAWLTGSFVTGLPGIILQLVLIPLLYGALAKAKLTVPRLADQTL